MTEKDNFTPWGLIFLGVVMVAAGAGLMLWSWSYAPIVMQNGTIDLGYGYTFPDRINRIAVYNAHMASDRDISMVGGGFLLLSGCLLLVTAQVVEQIKRLRPTPSEPAAERPQGE